MSEAGTSDLPIDLTSTIWINCVGRHGPYQRSSNGSAAYARLVSALKERGGSCIVEGFRVWIFCGRVYRKKLSEGLDV